MSRAQLLWALFAWLGIPILFMVCVALTGLPARPQGVMVLVTLAFVICGTWAIVKGHRPRRSWIVLLYPIPMFFVLAMLMTAMVLMGPRPV
jgi:hypothetical protein